MFLAPQLLLFYFMRCQRSRTRWKASCLHPSPHPVGYTFKLYPVLLSLLHFGTACLFDKCSVIWNDISFPGLEFEEEGRGSEIRVSVVRAF